MITRGLPGLVGCLLLIACAKALPRTTYKVTVKTSEDLEASSAVGDKVFLKLYGDQHTTDFKELRGDINAFQRNTVTTFTIDAKNVGKISNFAIKKTANGKQDRWNLKKVTVEDANGDIYEAMCRCWLSKKDGLERNLVPSNIIHKQQHQQQKMDAMLFNDATTEQPTKAIGSRASSSPKPSSSSDNNKPTKGSLNSASPVVTPSSKPSDSSSPSKGSGTDSKPTNGVTTSSKPSDSSSPSKGSAKQGKPTTNNPSLGFRKPSKPTSNVGSPFPSAMSGSLDKPANTSPVKGSIAMEVLNQINQIRLLHGSGPVILEAEMSRVAKKKANKLAAPNSRRSMGDDDDKGYGTSICTFVDTGLPSAVQAKICVSNWYKTVKDYDWTAAVVTVKSAQFARLVWKATTHIGIGELIRKNNESYVVVLFDPPSSDQQPGKENISPVTDVTDGSLKECHTGFTNFGRFCFAYHEVPVTWESAIAMCANRGAALASIQTQEENTFINGMLSAKKSNGSGAWIGFNDRIAESKYQWTGGSAAIYHQFLPTEPTGVGENCVAMTSSQNGAGWEDKKCSEQLPAICRMPVQVPVIYKITLQIDHEEVPTTQAPIPATAPPMPYYGKRSFVPGLTDWTKVIKQKINESVAHTGTPVEFVGDSSMIGSDGQYYVSVYLKQPPGSDPSPAQPLQFYLENNNFQLLPNNTANATIEYVSIVCGGTGCYTQCFTTCTNQNSPTCCSGTFILKPQAQPAAYPAPQPSPYPSPYPAPYQYPSSYPYPSPYPSVYQPAAYPGGSYPYGQVQLVNTSGCVRSCKRKDFCPNYCPKHCCARR